MEIPWLVARVHSQGGNGGSVLGAVSSKAPEQGYNGAGISSSRVVNSKIPYTLTLSLPFPVVRNQDLDHTIRPRHWTRPFTPHFRPSDRGKFLVEMIIFAW